MKNKQNGITLIALIITIIVLLILAGVTISMIVGENGILNQAVESSIATENATVYEQLQLKVADYQMEEVTDNVEENVLERLKEDGYVNSDNTVNVDVLIPNNDLKRGKGSLETGDVYVLEPRTDSVASGSRVVELEGITTGETTEVSYHLIYYKENKEETNLGKILDTKEEMVYEPTSEDYFEYNPETGGIALKDSNSYYDDGGIRDRNLGLDTIVVPSTYQGQTVTKIGMKYADSIGNFHTMGINATDVRKIILPDTITEIYFYGIGGGAFSSCTNLEEIYLPDSLKTIGSQSFDYCTSIDTLTIPESVTTVGSDAFRGWTEEQTIYVPFKEGELPSGWDSNWNRGCNATIIYAD